MLRVTTSRNRGPAAVRSRSAGAAPETIDAYVAWLSAALRGPRRVREDLVFEARDSLVDATEAYQADGLDPADAERRAVRDFGEIGEIAAGYRPELALAQARRTAVLLSVVLLLQPIIWAEGRWPWIDGSEEPTSPVFGVLDGLVEYVGGAAIAGTVLAIAACGIGVRVAAVRRLAAGTTGVFSLLSCITVSLMAVSLGLAAQTGPILPGVLWTVLFVVAPLGIVARSARNALAIATA
jgi:hypothetical protein